MATLYELEGEYKALVERLEDGFDTPEELDAAFDHFKTLTTDIYDKLDAYARIERNWRSDEEACRAEAKRFEERAQHYARLRAGLRRRVQECFEMAGFEKAKRQMGTFYWHISKSAVIEDETCLPEDFIEVIRKPKVSEIKKALLDGKPVDGAFLEERRTLAMR